MTTSFSSKDVVGTEEPFAAGGTLGAGLAARLPETQRLRVKNPAW
jgi:hypothetical protein